VTVELGTVVLSSLNTGCNVVNSCESVRTNMYCDVTLINVGGPLFQKNS
jgi:hypothetical protein